MSKIDDIKGIFQLVPLSQIHDFSLEYEGVKISFKKGMLNNLDVTEKGSQSDLVMSECATLPDVRSSEETNETAENAKQPQLKEIVSPMVGNFYASPEPNTPPYVQVGDMVTEGSIIGVVEAMKLYNEIAADISGEVVQIFVENDQLVEYGQPLFLVRTN